MNLSNKHHYNNFNLLRLFAALQVVYIHSLEHLEITNSALLYLGEILRYFPGVPIFFMISGYLITMSYENNPTISDYIKNRILRIYPGLYVSFLISASILYVFNQFDHVSFNSIFMWTCAQLTFVQFYNPEFIRDFGVGVINGSLWTISVELAFYIVLPIVYIFLKKNFIKRFTILMLISLSFYFYIQNISTKTLLYEKLIGVSILPYLFYFLIGMYVFQFRSKVFKYIEDKFYIYFIIYIGIILLSTDNYLYFFLQQFGYALFVFSLVFSFKNFTYKFMGYNDFTYGIYIYHMLIINILVHLNYIGAVENILWVLLGSIVCGVLSYKLVEKPFLKLKKKSLYYEISK